VGRYRIEDGRFSRDHLLQSAANDLRGLSEVGVIAIDIPIGFGPREADAAARRYLYGAASTVFTTPSREVRFKVETAS